MRLYTLIMDDFFDVPEQVREHAVSGTFKDEVSPFDGVAYKGVNAQVPLWVTLEVVTKLSAIFKSAIIPTMEFFRLTKEGVGDDMYHRPIHTDVIYGQYACVVYLNEKFPSEDTGTRLMYHPRLDLNKISLDEKAVRLWDKLAHDKKKWKEIGFIPMKWNRAGILDTKIFHIHSPKEGFGRGNKTGRLVYVMFFNVRGE